MAVRMVYSKLMTLLKVLKNLPIECRRKQVIYWALDETPELLEIERCIKNEAHGLHDLFNLEVPPSVLTKFVIDARNNCWTEDEKLAFYASPDELQKGFNLVVLSCITRAEALENQLLLYQVLTANNITDTVIVAVGSDPPRKEELSSC